MSSSLIAQVVMSSYQVRPATVRDAKAIAQIHIAAAQAAYQGLVPDEQLAVPTVEKRQAFWREAIEYSEPQVHVLTSGDEIVGFVGFDRSRDKGTPSTTGEIWAMYVHPEHWGKGGGVTLWDAANDGLKEEGCTKVTVWVPLRNERALRFMEQAGFKREMPSLKTVAFGSARLEEIRLKRALG
jgi:RimJ/RimL family protein N-acetyltransferase